MKCLHNHVVVIMLRFLSGKMPSSGFGDVRKVEYHLHELTVS